MFTGTKIGRKISKNDGQVKRKEDREGRGWKQKGEWRTAFTCGLFKHLVSNVAYISSHSAVQPRIIV